MDEGLRPLYDAIVAGSQADALACLNAALDAGLEPTRILNEGMIAAMQEVGALFEDGEYFVPDMLVSARAMQAALAEHYVGLPL